MKITKDYLKRLIKEEADKISAKKVWVVIEDYQDEGGKVVAVFDSKKAADARADKLNNEPSKSTLSEYYVKGFTLNK